MLKSLQAGDYLAPNPWWQCNPNSVYSPLQQTNSLSELSLYNVGMDPTENTVSNNVSNCYSGHCLGMSWALLRIYPVITTQWTMTRQLCPNNLLWLCYQCQARKFWWWGCHLSAPHLQGLYPATPNLQIGCCVQPLSLGAVTAIA
jgi:hypothetical protein